MKHLKASLTGLIALTAVIANPVALIRPAARMDVEGSTVKAPFRVVDKDNKTVFMVESLTDGTNIMILYGEYGALVGSVKTTSADLHIHNKKADYMFRAWVTSSGLGAVSVGPAGNGVAGSLTGGKPASALLGKKQ